jgi:hypothetical protein
MGRHASYYGPDAQSDANAPKVSVQGLLRHVWNGTIPLERGKRHKG